MKPFWLETIRNLQDCIPPLPALNGHLKNLRPQNSSSTVFSSSRRRSRTTKVCPPLRWGAIRCDSPHHSTTRASTPINRCGGVVRTNLTPERSSQSINSKVPPPKNEAQRLMTLLMCSGVPSLFCAFIYLAPSLVRTYSTPVIYNVNKSPQQTFFSGRH